jgi:hypothetical protein
MLISKRYLLRVCTTLALASLFAHPVLARTAELVDPAPIELAADVTPEQANKAVSNALAQKSWMFIKVVSNSPRIIEAEYRVRSHIMAVNIEFQPHIIKMSYARSEDLNYEVSRKNKVLIHPNYMVWAQQLADQIKFNLSLGNSLAASAEPQVSAAPTPPKIAFSAFGQFQFEPSTLAPQLANEETAKRTAINLDANIATALQPKVAVWNKPGNSRTLVIKPTISSLRFIGGGTRFLVGAMAGRSNITVDLVFIDQATSKIIGTTTIHRVATMSNGFTLARRDYAMVEDAGKDVIAFIDNNYSTPVDTAQTK